MLLIILGIYLEMKLMDHIYLVMFNILKNCHTISTVTAPFHIPTGDTEEF